MEEKAHSLCLETVCFCCYSCRCLLGLKKQIISCNF